ncbi:MAG: hypothetical protein IH892_18690 [Planctomycetes bacterium]|nr:hypothetical protein [Planctomycetota bacterium]
MAAGYLLLYKLTREPDFKDSAIRCLEWLMANKSPKFETYSWANHYDYASRGGRYGKHDSIIVWTALIGHVFLDGWEDLGESRFLNVANSSCRWILSLSREVTDTGTCLSYHALEQSSIHNANMLGASILIRLLKYTGDSACEEAALSSLSFSMSRQHEDGSWPYGDAKTQQWVDSFHTGFNLQALKAILDEGFAAEFREGFERGTTYYAETFFLADGTPKYFNNRVYPLDIHAPAEGICFFATLGDPYRAQTEIILDWMVSNMLSPQGYFYFRKTKYGTNRIPYMRWTQAWAFHALTQYMLAFQSEDRQVTVDA